MTQQQFFGVLCINKPAGMTSRKVVDRVVQLVKPAKAGHAGTLDPLASGVLVVCVGAATRLISQVQQQRKEYLAQFLLGRRSNTDDVSGEVVDGPTAAPATREQVEAFLPRFVGRIEQVPPQFSAVHVDGTRAHKLARRGQRVDLKPRSVDIYRVSLVDLTYPELELDIECGSGTYIRSIGRDLGELLGCGAVMSQLVRTRIGAYRLEAATQLQDLNPDTLMCSLQPAATAVQHLQSRIATPDELGAIRCGRPIPSQRTYNDGEIIALLTREGELACLVRFRKGDGTLAPKQVFPG